MAILTRMYQRRGTQAQWNAVANTVILQSGEIGLEHDTGRFKLGDGSSVWSNLPYYLPDNNPAASGIRQGKNAHDIYSKLSPLAPSYTQTFTGAQVLVPQNNAQTPLVVSGLSGQSAVLQRWRDSLDTTLASIDANGKLLAKGGAQFDANVNVNANKIINLAAPTNPQDATNKQYVDDAIAGLIWKSPVNLVSASGLDTFINVPLTGNTNTLILDGHAALDSTDTGYRILLVAQTTATENGIYVYNDNGTTYTLTRAVDADTYQELNSASVFVNEGTHYGTSSWVQTNHYLTSFADQDWVQFNGASQIVADGGLTKSGNTLAVGGTTDRIKINPNSVDISENYAGQTSITTLGTIGTGTWNATTIAANKGGTGQSSYAIGDILYASSTSALSKLSPGTSGYPLISGGTGNGPSYAQVNTTGIANDAVTYDKLQNISAQHRILGRASAGAGNAEELTPDQLMTTINQGNTDISFNLLPVGTTSTTVSQGDHTHTLNDLSDVTISDTPVARQVIKYDGTKWINELPSGGISIGATPPLDASSGDAWFDSTDGSLYVYYDDGVGSLITNFVTNPSFEVNTSGWSGGSGAVLTRVTSESYSGTASLDYYPLGSAFTNTTPFTVTASKSYTASAWVKGPIGKTINLDLYENTSAGANVGVTNSTHTFNGSWQRISVTRAFGATGTRAVLRFEGSSIVFGSEKIYIDAIQLEQGSVATTYFDGSTPGGTWTGTPHASTSTKVSTTSGNAQWVQVKANSALEASILTRLSAVEARDTKLEAANAVRVSSQSERTSVYPSPVQGNTVFRADLGYEEKYYAAYNATTNPDGTTGTPGWYRYAGGAPLSENYIINGGFDIWQRGTSFSSSGYTADRFYIGVGNSATLSRQATGIPVGSQYCARITYGAASSFGNVFTALEQAMTSQLVGKTVTISAKVRRNSSFTANLVLDLQKNSTPDSLNGGTWTTIATSYVLNSNIPTGIGSSNWYTLSATVTIPNDGTANGLRIRIGEGDVGPSGAYWELAQVQLEEGPVATPFRRNANSIQGELAACQRYYYRLPSFGLYTHFGLGTMANTTILWMTFRHPVEMRTTLNGIEWTNNVNDYLIGGAVPTGSPEFSQSYGNKLMGRFAWTRSSATTSGSTVELSSNNTTNAYFGFSAEL